MGIRGPKPNEGADVENRSPGRGRIGAPVIGLGTRRREAAAAARPERLPENAAAGSPPWSGPGNGPTCCGWPGRAELGDVARETVPERGAGR